MRFAFFGQLVGGGTVAAIVGLFGLGKTNGVSDAFSIRSFA
jgi:hypothetical protein